MSRFCVHSGHQGVLLGFESTHHVVQLSYELQGVRGNNAVVVVRCNKKSKSVKSHSGPPLTTLEYIDIYGKERLVTAPIWSWSLLRYPGFFWTFWKKLKAKKLQQIIQKLDNLPNKNWFFAQKSPEVDIFCTKICPNKLEIRKIQGILEKNSIDLNKLKEFLERLNEFLEKLRFYQLYLVFTAEKRPKKPGYAIDRR